MEDMRDGMMRGMMTLFSILRNSFPIKLTYMASRLLHGASELFFRRTPRPIPEINHVQQYRLY
jgi:hypothetical protein